LEPSHKVCVDVIAMHSRSGTILPQALIWEGQEYNIDKVTDARPMSSTKAGGTGMRYTCRIRGRESYLYYDGRLWYIEQK